MMKSSECLLQEYEYRVDTVPCDSTATRLRVVAEFEPDISCVFPYLNALSPECEYMPDAGVIRVKCGRRGYVLRAHEIMTGGLSDPSEAPGLIDRVRDLVNDTWERRAEIEPRHERRVRVPALRIFALLPRTNCGACGEKSCMAFAGKVSTRTASIDACTELDKAGRERLRGLWGTEDAG